ncbi:Hypothetical predicted protein [Scomber scombrus]|uniref:Uncharacterized protein n=1 Tax=Scomber scombrus TaxID=13677 RepID=A0AAV1P1B9_SCOSC
MLDSSALSGSREVEGKASQYGSLSSAGVLKPARELVGWSFNEKVQNMVHRSGTCPKIQYKR